MEHLPEAEEDDEHSSGPSVTPSLSETPTHMSTEKEDGGEGEDRAPCDPHENKQQECKNTEEGDANSNKDLQLCNRDEAMEKEEEEEHMQALQPLDQIQGEAESTTGEEDALQRLSPFIPRRRANALLDEQLSGEKEKLEGDEVFPMEKNQPQMEAKEELSSSDAPPVNRSNSGSTTPRKLSTTLSTSSAEEVTIEHPLHRSESDSEVDLEPAHDSPRASRVASGFYSMCGDLVRQTKAADPVDILPPHRQHRMKESFRQLPLEEEEVVEKKEKKEEDSSSSSSSDFALHARDIWTPIPPPSGHNIQCVCLSATSLWLSDSRGSVFWATPDTRELCWQPVKHPMGFISSSTSGKIVWGVYNGHAYTRLGISDLNHSGSSWKNVTKTTALKRQVRHVASDENAVWVVMIDGKVFFRREVSEGVPDGTIWQEISSEYTFSQIACCNNIVWALDSTGRSYVREGITPRNLSGEKWVKVKAPSLAAISMVTSGIVWGVDTHSQLHFRTGASKIDPAGSGPWWEVAHSSLTKSSTTSPTDTLWKFMSVERSNSLLTSMTARISSATPQRLLGISACNNTGVCVLTSDNQLNACWRLATGYHYEKVCKDEVFNLSIWTLVAAGNLVPWVVRDDGELYCVRSNSRVEHIECQGIADTVAASGSALWVVSKKQIWSRQRISAEMPQGISWDYIELGSHMQELKIVQLAVSNRVAWALDHRGLVHFRFGIHPREPGTGMAPAWIPVEDNVQPFAQIAISPDDQIVWACDRNCNVYARIGVTSDFPVGRRWELVPGEQAKQIAVTSGWVFTLNPAGDLLCRQGVTDTNPTGDYWRKLPGKFEKLSATGSGHLVMLDERGSVLQQQVKMLPVCDRRKRRGGTFWSRGARDLEKTVIIDEWEVI